MLLKPSRRFNHHGRVGLERVSKLVEIRSIEREDAEYLPWIRRISNSCSLISVMSMTVRHLAPSARCYDIRVPTEQQWTDENLSIAEEPECSAGGCVWRMAETCHVDRGDNRYSITWTCEDGHERTETKRIERPDLRWPGPG